MLGLRTYLVLPFAVVLAGVSASAQTSLSATITTTQENPPTNPVLSTGGARPVPFGTATFVVDATNTSMTFTATINNIDVTGTQTADPNDNLTAAHIHAGPTVSPTTNGGVVWGFFGAPLNDNNPRDIVVTPFANGVGGTFSGKWDAPEGNNTTLAAQLPNILAGRAYINFHTTQNGGGEIRGNITIAPGITTGAALPSGRIGVAYSQTLAAAAVGGGGAAAWTVTSGTLPPGITLSGAGVLSGTPTAIGTSNFTVQASTGAASFASKTFSLTVLPTTLSFTSALRVGHVVDAANFATQFSIVNLDSSPVSFQGRFWDDGGNALKFPIQEGSAGELAGTLAPGGVVVAQSPGSSSPLVQGWAEIASSGRISVLANSYRSSAPGGTDAEASVQAAPSTSSVILPFDNTQGFASGIAVANTNASQSIVVTVTVTPDGGSPTVNSFVLAAHGHTAFVLAANYPAAVGVRGTVRFTTNFADLAVTGLRFSPKNSFSSLGGAQ
jgi:CHRD domain-containing protein/putative Ig domain-containing protein